MKAKLKTKSKTFWDTVKETIEWSNMLLIILDARFIQETMNKELIEKIKKENKAYLFVVTKTDLKDNIDKIKIPRPYILVSKIDKRGKSMLRKKILSIGEKKLGKNCKVKVGVLGYPNVGKSTVINMLKGRKSARTSIHSGYTKSEQYIRAGERFFLIDTPGVIPYGEKDAVKHVLTGITDFNRIKNPDSVLKKILKKYPGVIEKYFGVKPERRHIKTIEKIALKRNLLKKGGVPDIDRASRMIIKEFQKGKLRLS